MTTLGIDLEVYSPVDLGACGVHKYARHKDTEILLFGFAVDDDPVEVIEVADGQKIPKEILTMLTEPSVLKTAYNAAFERTVLSESTLFTNSFSISPPEHWEEQWLCSMVLAAQAGLPLGLEAVCQAMGLPPDKAKKDGRALIRYFCQPCPPTIVNGGRTRNYPWDDYEKWERFVSYNRRDVEVEQLIRRKLWSLRPNETEQRFWCLDQKINDRGVKLDKPLIENAIAFNEKFIKALTDEAIGLTGIKNVKSQSQIKEWLAAEEGKTFDSLNKKALPEVMEQIQSDKSKRLMELRSEINKTSNAKYDKMMDYMCGDEHARGLFQFYGASRTGRFAGRGIQLQNLSQNHLDDITDVRSLVRAGQYDELKEKHPNISSTLSELIRTAIIPEDGCRFIIADFSAIEARVIAWLAGEEWVLDAFRSGADIYCQTASRMFGVPVEKNGINGHLRQRGKVATLACSYQGSVSAMRAMDTGRILINEPDSTIKRLVQDWRNANPHIVELWGSIERAAKMAIRTRSSAKDEVAGIVFDYERKNLFMNLPSGRRLCYVNAQLGENRFGNEAMIYAGQNQTTKKWEMMETYSGRLVENLTQAVARDCLRDAMMRLDENGYDIRMHVHDEVIINEPIGSGRTLDDVIGLMCTVPDWAQGLPLNAAGFESEFYMKD